MPLSSLEPHRSDITEAVIDRVCGRSASSFRRIGEQACRQHVEAVLDALWQDLASGKPDAVRGAVQTLVEELATEGLTFADLRFFVETLRKEVLGALDSAGEGEGEGEARSRRLEEWMFDLVLVSTMRFIAQRDKLQQERTAKLELGRLENQLVELQVALAEKTRLLDVIRQASTPIAPVVQGILVVPLVGMFDAFRAELLTEKLLQEVSRARARSVILDISGVPVVDTEAAQLIIRLTRAVRLLGTELLLVGLSPDSARTIVELGISLEGLATFGSLQAGLADALMRQRLRITAVEPVKTDRAVKAGRAGRVARSKGGARETGC